ncbi:MAG TPA: hypothetical protein VFM21_08460 [Terriglobia bacterium]|nr:hypothetical protein [Terriglobia bacterium]
MKYLIGVLILIVSAPPAANAGNKPMGSISDVAAFNKIRSYCIDSSDLSTSEANDVQAFIRTESKPKGLLVKLPWKLVADCAQGSPDAVAKLKFHLLNKVGMDVGNPATDPMSRMGLYNLRAWLGIYDSHSSELLYEVEASPLDNPNPAPTGLPDQEPLPLLRRNATYRAFWMLIDDLRLTSKQSNGHN